MLKDDLENIRKEVERKRKEKDEEALRERVKKVSERFSKIIDALIAGLTNEANKGYASFTLKNVKNFYVANENELWDWARSEKINLSFRNEKLFITESDDRSKIKVTEIVASF
jgi:hypothetical protein